jgi:hypothetical protein
MCRGKIPFPFPGVTTLTLIAVGVGVAPMIQVLRAILKSRGCRSGADSALEGSALEGSDSCCRSCDDGGESVVVSKRMYCGVQRVVLLYGVVSPKRRVQPKSHSFAEISCVMVVS